MARAPLAWFGGKGNMLGMLLPLIPQGGDPYCEPYAGGAATFWVRRRATSEVLSDLDADLINFYQVLQDESLFPRLWHMVAYTLYSRAELAKAIQVLNGGNDDRLLRAWAIQVAHRMGMSGKMPSTPGQWARAFVSESGQAKRTLRWNSLCDVYERFHERLRGVRLLCMDALQVLQQYDNDDAVFYVDPPYHHQTRKNRKVYRHEASHNHHEQLVQTLLHCKGAVTLSGYKHDVYQPLENAGWQRLEFQTACHAAGRTRGANLIGKGAVKTKVPRTECVWLNPKAQRLLAQERGILPIVV